MIIYLALVLLLGLGIWSVFRLRFENFKIKKELIHAQRQIAVMDYKVEELGFLYNRQALEFMKHMTYFYHSVPDDDGRMQLTNAALTPEQEFSLKKLEVELDEEAKLRGYPPTLDPS